MSFDMKKLMEESKNDTQLDLLSIENELVNIPLIHAKWLNYFHKQKARLTIIETDYRRLVSLKTKYFLGKLDDDLREKLGWELEGTKILKADVGIWLDSDNDCTESKIKLQLEQQILELIAKTMDMIIDKKWLIKNYIEWKRWTEGG